MVTREPNGEYCSILFEGFKGIPISIFCSGNASIKITLLDFIGLNTTAFVAKLEYISLNSLPINIAQQAPADPSTTVTVKVEKIAIPV